jgi:hypothetical protein
MTLVVIGTDCIGSYKSNYRMITTMTVPILNGNSLKLCMLVYYHMYGNKQACKVLSNFNLKCKEALHLEAF